MGSLFLATGDSLRLTLSAAADTDVAIFYNGGRVLKSYGAADTVDVFDAISAVDIGSILITNRHATTSQNVSVYIHTRDGLQGTIQLFPTTTLLPSQQLAWSNGTWITPSSAAKLNQMRYVTADYINTQAVTLTAITGLSWSVTSGKVYALNCALIHKANAATNGARFAVGGVACTFIQLGTLSGVTNSVTASALSTGSATAVDTVTIAQTASDTSNVPTFIFGSFQPSASGTMYVKGSNEDANAAGLTVAKGSWAWLREVD
ncbi:MAG TPA: hypothetical protein VK208_15140 [Pyrinomonadaceae bacterium]|nr:hypothetical protein [Pyrinomonadaceae bacterium]